MDFSFASFAAQQICRILPVDGEKSKGNKERVHLGKSLIYYGLHTNLLVLLALCCLHLQLIRVKKRF